MTQVDRLLLATSIINYDFYSAKYAFAEWVAVHFKWF